MNPTALQTTRCLVRRACMTTGLLCLGLTSQAALAEIGIGIGMGFSAQYPNNPELFLTLLDQTTAQMTYTLDLNVRAATFFINAQQDSGSYLFFTLDPSTDAALQTFVNAAGTNLSTTRWAVLGFNDPLSGAANRVLYSTMTNNGDVATQAANYDALFKTTNGTLRQNNALASYLGALNNATTDPHLITMTTLKTASSFGSSLATASDSIYANKVHGWANAANNGDGDCLYSSGLCVGNPVGTSSWFYRTQLSSTSNIGKVAVDEFDNLTNDGYWGFIKDPNSNKYVLSYTLPGSNPKSLVSTDAGRARLSITDYSASAGPTRLLTVGQDDIANAGIQVAAFANAASVSPVPEPQTWGLMALGGLLVAARARRERRSAGLSHRA